MRKNEVLKILNDEKVNYLRLQFTDLLGINKNVEVPPMQFQKAVDGKIMFDGSSIEGFSRIEESDMLLQPDMDTLMIYPWNDNNTKVARLICDIYNPDGTPFAGCPREALKRVTADAMKEDREKILIIDDDVTTLGLLEKALSEHGYRPLLAECAVQAFKLLQEHMPRVIVLDWIMTKKDGLQICREIRSRRADNPTYIIMLTVQAADPYHGTSDILELSPPELSRSVEVM